MAQHLRSPHAMSSLFAFIWHLTIHCPGTGLCGLPPITAPAWRGRSYQQPRYRRHSSCGHWDTQAPQPIQNGDTNTGIPCCAVHTFTYPHRRDTFFCFFFKSRSNSAELFSFPIYFCTCRLPPSSPHSIKRVALATCPWPLSPTNFLLFPRHHQPSTKHTELIQICRACLSHLSPKVDQWF